MPRELTLLFALAVGAAGGCALKVSTAVGGGPDGSGGAPVSGSGGAPVAGRGGAAVSGGSTGAAGAGSGGVGGTGNTEAALDCGPAGIVIENAGPPANRVNYVIVGDGYTQAELATTFRAHVMRAVAQRFAMSGQPYARYRKFVNICALAIPSAGGVCGASALGCCGDDNSHLANCDDTKVNAAIKDNLPASFLVDWKAVVLNTDHWWNSGGSLMYWSGGHASGALAALHEGAHGFHQLSDEFEEPARTCTPGDSTTNYMDINVAGTQALATKAWGAWTDVDQRPGTGYQGFFQSLSGCTYRPSDRSIMYWLSATGTTDSAFNGISAEHIARGMYRYVQPIDAVVPPAGPISKGAMLQLKVIDPDVINVEWWVDGKMFAGPVPGDSGLDTSALTLAAGTHTIEARVYDNASGTSVRQSLLPDDPSVTPAFSRSAVWKRSQQTVTWTATVP